MDISLNVTAAYVDQRGPAQNISYGLLQLAGPGPTDVVVRVEAVAANPVDTFVRSGQFATPVPLPLILGRDLVGRVLEAPASSPWEPGQWVWANSLGHAGRQGSFADRAVVPSDRLYPLARGADPERAVAVAHPASTAALGWFEHGQLRAGQTVFVGAGGGNVGHAAVAMATAAGARVIASASDDDAERVRAAGAQVILDHHHDDFATAVTDATAPGVDICWDTSGRIDYRLLGAITAIGGRILVTAAAPEAVPVPWAQLYTRDVTVTGFVHSRARTDQLARAADRINQWLPAGLLTPNITERLPLARARDAHEQLESGQVRGRIVLTPEE